MNNYIYLKPIDILINLISKSIVSRETISEDVGYSTYSSL